jgi:lipid-A-disaccharide synthase
MTARPFRIFITSGETSGDLLAAQLMAALKELTGGAVVFEGVGGPRMTAEGLTSLFPADDIAVMGLVDILPKLRILIDRIWKAVRHAAAMRPDLAILVDVPGFNLRIAERLKPIAPDIPIVLYVAPQAWAWRPKRAVEMRAYVDHILALLPFEPAFFAKAGVRCTHVGHPVVERFPGGGLGAGFRARHDISPDTPVLAVLPGSRRKEVSRLAPVFAETLSLLKAKHPKLVAVVPTVPHVAGQVREAASAWPLRNIVVEAESEKYPAFEAADAALAASGTVALELALAGTPMVIAYKVDWGTAFYVRRAIQVKYANLINLIADRPIVPELIQENCTAANLARETDRLLSDQSARAAQRAAFETAARALGLGQESPSRRAAKAALATLPDAAKLPG